jgi:hypothetical protein
VSSPPGMLSYRIGGHVYPRTARAGCAVCASPYRSDIEVAISSGQNYTGIIGGLPEGSQLEVRHLSTHFRAGHMPLRQSAMRKIIEDREVELGKAIEDGADSLADHVMLARVVVQRSFERIAKGELEPTVADGIAAAKILQTVGVDDSDTDKAAYAEAFMIWMETAQQVMTEDQFLAFGASLNGNPVLQGLVSRYQRKSVGGAE